MRPTANQIILARSDNRYQSAKRRAIKLVSKISSDAFQTAKANPADEAARRWRASLPGELRRRSLVRGGALLSLAALGYVAAMVGEVWLPTFFGRTLSLMAVPLMIGVLFV